LWVGLDQAASSGTNFAAAALAAGLLTAAGFGGWAIAYTVYLTVLTAVRTWVGDCLLIFVPGVNDDRSFALTSGAASLSVALGVASGCGVAFVALFLKGGVQSGLLALAPCIPFLTFQDCVRYALLSTNRAKAAFWNDACWFAFTVSFMLVLRRTDTVSVELAVLAFGAASIPSALIGARQVGLTRPWSHLRFWLRTATPFAWRIMVEYVVYTVSSMTMVLAVIALTAPIESVGFVRSAQTMMGPMSVFFAATTIYLQPELVRLIQQSRPFIRVAVQGTMLNVAFTGLWFGILLLVPRTAGIRVFGASWDGAQDVLPLVAILFVISGVGAGATNLLRSQHRVRVSVNARLVGLLIVVPATVFSASAGDVHVILGTFAVTSTVTPLLLWVIALRGSNEPVSDV
jgi:O-antigen/teichoic acid export membrane protein